MELPAFLRASSAHGIEIKTIEMHTTGEPTRIIYAGYPKLSGTLLEQRAEGQSQHDHVRRALIYEPRGHREMYGAVLCADTELVAAGEAHVGVLFLTNEGYSTMCGHATLAVARLLVDQSQAEASEPPLFALGGKKNIEVDKVRQEAHVALHVPCGLVQVTVPVVASPTTGCWRTDTTRPISYLSVPSYATGMDVAIPIPDAYRWPELGKKNEVVVDIAYGGAYYIIAAPSALGFPDSLAKPDLAGLSITTRGLKDAFNSSARLRECYLRPSDHPDLEFLYGTILTDAELGTRGSGTMGAETSLCFFSNSQIDRSPTGSGVQAKVALAHAKGQRELGARWTYHSLVSNSCKGNEGAFVGEAVREVGIGEGRPAVIVKVSGWARYTGASTFIVEDGDEIGQGFCFEGVASD